MEHTDSFTYRLLLVAKDEKSAKEINHHFTKAGLIGMDTETGINNVIPKLNKDNTYEGLVLDAAATGNVVMYINKLKASRNGAKLPIIVLNVNPEDTWIDITHMYDAGANFVVTSALDEDVANHVLWIFNSMVTFVEQFKKGMERLYPR
jgi:DNA-binding response OmpR family regulator